MPAEQSSQAPALRTVVAIGTSLCTLAVNCNGFYHGPTAVEQTRLAMGGHRPIHQDGPLRTTERKNGGRFGGHICARNMEAPWDSDRDSI